MDALAPRWVILHGDSPLPDGFRGHVFGPFDSYEEADAFDHGSKDDPCYRTSFVVVGPANRDVAATVHLDDES